MLHYSKGHLFSVRGGYVTLFKGTVYYIIIELKGTVIQFQGGGIYYIIRKDSIILHYYRTQRDTYSV